MLRATGMTRTLVSAALVSLALVAGCASAPVGGAEDELATSYGSLIDTLQGEEQDAWIAVRRKLREGFDRVCGDTICSGDFGNLTTVRLTCSSTRSRRKMKDCVWVLGGNVDHVDPVTGAHAGEARAFACHISVAGSAKTFLAALTAAGDDALHATLPGTTGSFYDGLVSCFEGVTASAPPPAAKGDHAELGDFLWEKSPDAGAAWSESRRALASAFDDACGDTFCEGDFKDVSALRLACDVRRSDEHVGVCHWSFALADDEVDARGRIVPRTATKTCPIAIDAPASALVAAVAGEDGLHAPLPGRETSLLDALVGCL